MSNVLTGGLGVSMVLMLETGAGRKRGRGTYGDVPFPGIGCTFLVVEGDGVDMGQKAIVSTDRCRA
jgi:hypothetical protein